MSAEVTEALVVGLGLDGDLFVFDRATRRLIDRRRRPTYAVALMPASSERFFVLYSDGAVIGWDTQATESLESELHRIVACDSPYRVVNGELITGSPLTGRCGEKR